MIKVKSSSETNTAPSIIVENGSKLTDPDIIANNFNDYFLNVAYSIAKKIPKNPHSPLKYLKAPNNSSFQSPTLPGEVSFVIQSLKESKSTGPNSIPVKLLKILNPHISI